MKYLYFPGCSLDASAVAYDLSIKAMAGELGIDLKELEDWNCCGSSPYSSVDELLACCVSARNLAIAEKQKELALVTACSACYRTLGKTNELLKRYPQLKGEVDEALAAGGLEYHGGVRVRHLAEVLLDDVGPHAIAAKVQKKLDGLKVAVYYGCQLVRPRGEFDDPELPQSLDRLVDSLGAKAVPFPLKSRCCGGSLIISDEGVALGLIKKLLDSASFNGAECIITICPLCQTNLDVYQGRVNSRFKTHYEIPVLFFTQLVGLALGKGTRELGIDKGMVSAEKLLTRYR